MKILVTGGAGFIGSHATLLLLQAGFDVLVLDNLSNSSAQSMLRVEKIVGRSVAFVQGDIRDSMLLRRLFSENAFSAVVHFAGLKAVGESVSHPLRYYDNNVQGSQVLLQAMSNAGLFNIVFSSSARRHRHLLCRPNQGSARSGLESQARLTRRAPRR